MCEPTTIAAIATYAGASAETAATIGTVGSIASVGLGAVGAYQQGQMANAMAKANAAEAERAAQDAKTRGEKDAQEARRNAGLTIGAQRASLAQRGLDLEGGTPADLIDQTDFFGQVDQAEARTNARRVARGYQVQAADYRAQGAAAARNGNLTAFSTLLGGAGKVADKWYQNRKPFGDFAGYAGRY